MRRARRTAPAPSTPPPAPRRRPLLTAVVLTLLLLAAPHVAAEHGDDLEIQATSGPLAPLDAPLEREVTAHVPCEDIHDREDLQPVDLILHDTPAWLRVTVSPHTVPVDPEDCPRDPSREDTLPAHAVLLIQATGDAPAFTRAEVRLTATLQESPWNATSNITVEADFLNLVNVHAAPKLVTADPGDDVAVPLEVTNLGNDRVRVTLRTVDRDGVKVSLPDAQVARSLQQGDLERTTTLTATFRAPTDLGPVSRSDTVHLEVVSRHYQRLDLDAFTRPVTFLVKTQGLGVPAPAGAAASLVLAGAAWVLGRRPARP